MELQTLTYFLAVIDKGSFSAAARTLNITQPALTKRIRALEDELGVPLFDRLPRGVSPTAYGESLARRARLIRREVDNAGAEIDSLRGARTGNVRIGAGPSWVNDLLPRAIAGVHRDQPEIQFQVFQLQDERMFAGLRYGELDIVVAAVPPPPGFDEMECTALISDDLKVVARADHPLTRRSRLGLRDLLEFPWILASRQTTVRQQFEQLFRMGGLVAPEPFVETDALALRLALPRQGDFLSFSASQNLVDFRAGSLVALDVPECTWRRDAGVSIRAKGHLPPAARRLVRELVAVCGGDAGTMPVPVSE